MRAASAELIARIEAQSTTLARLLTITRKDGQTLRFTDSDREIIFGGQTFRADISFTTSAILTTADIAAAQNLELTVFMDDDGIKEKDLRAKRYVAAVGLVEVVDYLYPQYGSLILYRGSFGRVKITDKLRATIELRALSTGAGGTLMTEVYSATCRAALGDARCTVDLNARKASFTVLTVPATDRFTAAALNQADGHWTGGNVKWLTGENAGLVMDVRHSDQSETSVYLIAAPLLPIQAGDTGEVFPGCDKQPTTCRDTFSNMVNFRGENLVPQNVTWGVPTPGPQFLEAARG